MPPHMLADLDRATFSNIEQQSLEFVVYTLMPWLEIWEQAINRTLLQPNERSRYFAEHNVAGLLRGDLASRAEGVDLAAALDRRLAEVNVEYATKRESGRLSIT